MFLKKYFIGLKNFDWILFGAVFLLICFGLAALYSISVSFENPDFLNFKKQIIFVVIGLVFLFLASFFDYRFWQDYSYLIYIAVAIILLAVLFFGVTVHGTTGWFSFVGFNFQPVELAKMALVIFLAWFLSRKINFVKDVKNFLILGVAAGLYFLLVAWQPDLGSAIILFLIWLLMIIFAGVSKKHLIFLAVILVLFSVVAWFFLLQDYQKDRIATFFDPQSDPYGRGYHVRQAMTAIGAGGFMGRGLGFGSQSQLKFIPASQTDFIFAVVAEELGFIGVSLVLFLFGLIFYRLVKAVQLMKDSFSTFFILGTTIILFSQVIINIGMNIGLVPVTGISLPFLSYGGSFLIVSLVLIGVVESMIARNKI